MDFPEWAFVDEVDITCVYHEDIPDVMVFLFDNHRTQSDSFVVTFIEELLYINGVLLEGDKDWEKIEIICRMTDPLVMNPNGPPMGEVITVNPVEIRQEIQNSKEPSKEHWQ